MTVQRTSSRDCCDCARWVILQFENKALSATIARIAFFILAGCLIGIISGLALDARSSGTHDSITRTPLFGALTGAIVAGLWEVFLRCNCFSSDNAERP